MLTGFKMLLLNHYISSFEHYRMNVHLFLLMVDLPLISAVTSLSVHPSGKLALSVGTDATLRTWNLVKGRQAYATNLGK